MIILLSLDLLLYSSLIPIVWVCETVAFGDIKQSVIHNSDVIEDRVVIKSFYHWYYAWLKSEIENHSRVTQEELSILFNSSDATLEREVLLKVTADEVDLAIFVDEENSTIEAIVLVELWIIEVSLYFPEISKYYCASCYG